MHSTGQVHQTPMQNTVCNILTINGTEEQVAQVRNYIKGANGEPISFQSIFPMPKRLKGKKSVEFKNAPYPKGMKPISIPDWMDWRWKYWGCSWDAEPIQDDAVEAPNCIIFNTADSTPQMAIGILSILFPEVSLHVTFSDEYADQYCGEYAFSGGKVITNVCYNAFAPNPADIPTDQKMEYYFLTHEYDRENWKKDEDGEWVNIYDEDNE